MCTTDCVGSCSGKECGDNGCGGSCGDCGADFHCNSNGICAEGCEANCLNQECGDDGCGGSCGICGEATVCKAGQCLDPDAPWPDVIGQPDGAGDPHTCPAGYYFSSGNCIPQLTEEKSSGCSTGAGVGTTPLLLLALCGLLLFSVRRRFSV